MLSTTIRVQYEKWEQRSQRGASFSSTKPTTPLASLFAYLCKMVWDRMGHTGKSISRFWGWHSSTAETERSHCMQKDSLWDLNSVPLTLKKKDGKGQMQEIEPWAPGQTNRDSNLEVCLPPPLGETTSHILSSCHLTCSWLLSVVSLTCWFPQKTSQKDLVGYYKKGLVGYCTLGGQKNKLHARGHKAETEEVLTPSKSLFLFYFFHSYHSPADCRFCIQILITDNMEMGHI